MPNTSTDIFVRGEYADRVFFRGEEIKEIFKEGVVLWKLLEDEGDGFICALPNHSLGWGYFYDGVARIVGNHLMIIFGEKYTLTLVNINLTTKEVEYVDITNANNRSFYLTISPDGEFYYSFDRSNVNTFVYKNDFSKKSLTPLPMANGGPNATLIRLYGGSSYNTADVIVDDETGVYIFSSAVLYDQYQYLETESYEVFNEETQEWETYTINVYHWYQVSYGAKTNSNTIMYVHGNINFEYPKKMSYEKLMAFCKYNGDIYALVLNVNRPEQSYDLYKSYSISKIQIVYTSYGDDGRVPMVKLYGEKYFFGADPEWTYPQIIMCDDYLIVNNYQYNPNYRPFIVKIDEYGYFHDFDTLNIEDPYGYMIAFYKKNGKYFLIMQQHYSSPLKSYIRKYTSLDMRNWNLEGEIENSYLHSSMRDVVYDGKKYIYYYKPYISAERPYGLYRIDVDKI